MPDEAAEHADFVIQGEAEDAFVNLLESIENGEEKNLPNILGTKLRENFDQKIDSSKTHHNIQDFPLPDLNLIHGHEKIKIAPVITSRGCPFDCPFCSVIEMFSQQMRYDENERIFALLKRYKTQGIDEIFFYDDNFAANISRTKAFLEGMIRENCVPKRWTAQMRATDIVRDKELVSLMKRTNCFMVYMGLESVNPATLKEFNKRQTIEQIAVAVRLLKEQRILTHGMFVFGAESDTIQSVRETADFVIRNDISTVQFMILTPLPGTRYYQKLHDQGRIFDYDWNRYDAHHTVFYPNNMSPFELQTETFNAMKRVYTLSRAVIPIFDRNFVTPLYRMHGHKLINSYMRSHEKYTAGLPKQTVEKIITASDLKLSENTI
jgi:radical SAM superfamily enzyme YgiQ (UPF0313 family)